MNERVKCVAAMFETEENFGELCERFGISERGRDLRAQLGAACAGGRPRQEPRPIKRKDVLGC